MSDRPFGFGRSPGDDPDQPGDPFGGMFDPAKMGQLRPEDIGAAFQKIGQLLSWDGGPVNWDLARDVARQTAAAAGPDRSVSGAERAEVAEAVRLAELWLDPATTLAVGTSSTSAWSRAEWIEGTLPVWKQLVEPVAARVVAAMQETLTAQAPPEMAAMAGPVVGMMRSMGGAMFGAQVGQALGSLAGEVVGSTDVGLPLGPDGRAVLLPANVTAFGEGLGVSADQVRLYLALREAAHQRLFGHVPWLRSHLFSLVESYASGIAVDTSALEDAIGRLDPTNPEALQEALSGGLFAPQVTSQQQGALDRLETALALVEGWVDTVVHEAASGTLPAADALRETVRRRRAAGGPAEQTFASLVGLELRPRRLREAAALWTALREARGIEGRDAVWAHPDLMPGAEDLDNPQGFLQRRALDDLDISELDAAPDAEVPTEPGAEASGEPDTPRDAGNDAGEPDTPRAGNQDEPGDAGNQDEPGDQRPGG